MRRTIVAVALALLTATAWAQIRTVGTVLSIGQWIVQSNKKLYYTEVESTAPNFKDAQAEGFRLAVEYAVGSLILSDSVSENQHLSHDQIITYAAGYVDRYEIVHRSNVDNQIRLVMKVWVAHSAIADRLLNQSQSAGVVEGKSISAQASSIIHQRQTGDRVLQTVMADYPHRAFNVQMESTRAVLDTNRQVQLQIPVVIEWNKTYLGSLEEALKAINHYPHCNTTNDVCRRTMSRVELHVNYLKWNPGAWFNDNVAWNIMLDNMVKHRPAYQLTLHTTPGQKINYCYPAPELDESQYRSEYFANIGPGRVIVNGLHTARIVLSPQVDARIMPDVTRATVEIVRQHNCKS